MLDGLDADAHDELIAICISQGLKPCAREEVALIAWGNIACYRAYRKRGKVGQVRFSPNQVVHPDREICGSSKRLRNSPEI